MDITKEVTMFEVGGIGDIKLKAVRFPYYAVEDKQNGDFILYPYIEMDNGQPEVKLPYYMTGQEMLADLCNLYKSISEVSIDTALPVIINWCFTHIHPYYPPELMRKSPEWDWPEHWVNLLCGDTGIGAFSVIKMITELKELYITSIALFTMLTIQRGEIDEAKKLYYSNIGNESPGYDLFEHFLTEKQYKRSFILEDIGLSVPRFRMGLQYDENTQKLVFAPMIESVFDMAWYALSRAVAVNAPALNTWDGKLSITYCEACGKFFIKDGNRQKYCKDPECQSYRNRKKSKTYYTKKNGKL